MLTLHHTHDLTLDEVIRVADGAKVALDPGTHKMLDDRREQIEAHIKPGVSAYGFTRGFGDLQDRTVPPEKLAILQQNLLRSHASGVGPEAPRRLVRAAMLLRAQSLSRGCSGVRGAVVQHIVDMLNVDLLPVIPMYGSVGASGDLAPLSHLGIAMMGEGPVTLRGERMKNAKEAFAKAGLEPITFAMKEGLALNNGTVFSSALGVLAAVRLQQLVRTAAIATALAVEVFTGFRAAFRPELHARRPHPGPVRVAWWLSALLAGSPLLDHADPQREGRFDPDDRQDGNVQDPYSLRCTPAILGTAKELVDDAIHSLTTEINAVTDNPLVLPIGDRYVDIVSGGHFHGMPIAVRVYGLLQAACITATLSNTRSARYVDAHRNRGLPACLIWPPADPTDGNVLSGLMIPEYVSAAVTNALWGAAMPSHLMSIPTAAGQEDHVSMAAGLGARLNDVLPRLEEALAVELLLAVQAAEIRLAEGHLLEKADGTSAPLPEEARRLSPAGEVVRTWVREITHDFVPVKEDRSPSAALQAIATGLAEGLLTARVQAVVPLPWESAQES